MEGRRCVEAKLEGFASTPDEIDRYFGEIAGISDFVKTYAREWRRGSKRDFGGEWASPAFPARWNASYRQTKRILAQRVDNI